MDNEFPGSTDLALILKWYGWALYDVTVPPTRIEPFSWDEIAMRDRADFYQFSHKYYLLPIPQENETICSAYKRLRGDEQVSPILRFPKRKKKLGVVAEQGRMLGLSNCYYLDEFCFKEDCLITFANQFVRPNHPSKVTISTPKVVETFSEYFTLVRYQDNKISFQEPLKRYVN